MNNFTSVKIISSTSRDYVINYTLNCLNCSSNYVKLTIADS